METKDYKVTAKAGDWVAGKRNPGPNKVLKLTEEQARYALIAKEVEEVQIEATSGPASPVPPVDPVPVSKTPRKQA